MEIILLERVEKLGQMGDVVKVKPGYARNFLLPQGKALRANKANLERFETEKSQREADNLARRSDAETEAGKMDGLAVSIHAVSGAHRHQPDVSAIWNGGDRDRVVHGAASERAPKAG